MFSAEALDYALDIYVGFGAMPLSRKLSGSAPGSASLHCVSVLTDYSFRCAFIFAARVNAFAHRCHTIHMRRM